jgi:uncharacterized lipoprotein YddW (UPF0748 family)
MRLLFLVLLNLIPLFLSGKNIHQDRSALWVVRDALTTKAEIDEIISTAIDLNISDIFIQIRALGQTYYDSHWESKSVTIIDNFDPLQYIIDRSARFNLRIHAWVNMFYVWSGNQLPKNKNHILNKHIDFVLRNDNFPDYKSLRREGYEGYFLDPKVSAVQKDLLNILKELTERYDISGIHLDYYRYPGLAYSFTPASRTLYMLKEVYDPWKIYFAANTYSEERGYKVFLHADREYRKTLIKTLTDYLVLISSTIKSINPELELSLAVKPDPVVAKHRYFQDWVNWLERGYCDFVLIMNYRTKWDEFSYILKQLKSKNLKRKIIVGISTYNQDALAVMRRLEFVRSEGFAGFSLFSYNYLLKNKNYLDYIRLNFSAGG